MYTEPRIVFARFTGKTILGEMGRLLYSILNTFSVNSYQVQLFDNIDFAGLDKYGQQVPSIDNLRLVDSVPDNSGQMLCLYDKDDGYCSGHQWKKKIQVKFDVFSPYWITDPLIMPYPVHPLLAGADLPARLGKLRNNEKKLRIFFSGDTKGYTKNRIHYPNTKLPRLEVIDTILEHLEGKTIHARDEAVLNELFRGDFVRKCVIVDTSRLWIDPAEWLPDLSRADFFLCPPGRTMPMCHNVIEAMAVGTIPVISYPEWFTPALRHMENCIVFGDREDLIGKIKAVLEMGQHEISWIRSKVIEYYENHLCPETFIRDIEARQEDRLTVLMITDENTIKYSSMLNGKSILIRGKPILADSRLYSLFRFFRT